MEDAFISLLSIYCYFFIFYLLQRYFLLEKGILYYGKSPSDVSTFMAEFLWKHILICRILYHFNTKSLLLTTMKQKPLKTLWETCILITSIFSFFPHCLLYYQGHILPLQLPSVFCLQNLMLLVLTRLRFYRFVKSLGDLDRLWRLQQVVYLLN